MEKPIAIRIVTFLFIVILALHLFVVAALAAPGDVKIASPSSGLAPNTTFTVPVTIETSSSIPLGGYDLTVNYNPSVVIITAISGGSAAEFGAPPTTNPATFSSGSTDFNAINTTSLTSPTGVVEVAKITFKVVGSLGDSSTLALTINSLVDTDGFDITPTNTIDGSVTVGQVPTGFNLSWLFLSGLFLSLMGSIVLLVTRRNLRRLLVAKITEINSSLIHLKSGTVSRFRFLFTHGRPFLFQVSSKVKSLSRRYHRQWFKEVLRKVLSLLSLKLRKLSCKGALSALGKSKTLRLIIFFVSLSLIGVLIFNGIAFAQPKTGYLAATALFLFAFGFSLLKERRFAYAYLATATILTISLFLHSTLSLLPLPHQKLWLLPLALGLIGGGLHLKGRGRVAKVALIITVVLSSTVILERSFSPQPRLLWLIVVAILMVSGILLKRKPLNQRINLQSHHLEIFKKVVAAILVLALTANSAIIYLSPKTLAYLFWVFLCLVLTLYLSKRKSLPGLTRELTYLPLALLFAAVLVLSLSSQPALATPSVFGDANEDGTFNQDDYRYVQRYLARFEIVPPMIEKVDSNGDNNLSIKHALFLAQVSNGLRSSFSSMLKKNKVTISAPVGGHAHFEGAAGVAPGSATINIKNRNSGDITSVPANPDGSFSTSIPANANDSLAVTVMVGGKPTPPQTFTVPTAERISPPAETILTRAPGKPQETPNPLCCKDEKEPQGHVPSKEDGRDNRSVYLNSGEFYEIQTDLRIPGRGFDFEFTRKYKSQVTYNGPVGYNWDFNYNKRILKSGSDIVFFDGYGRRDLYQSDGAGGFTSPPGFFTKLTENQSGSFTLRDRDGMRYLFNPFDGSGGQGKLAAIVDKNKNTMRFFHDINGKLIKVVDTLGREITFTYGSSRIVKISDFAGREVTFTYDGNGDLVAVTSPKVTGTPNGNDFPSGKTTKYAYSSGNPNPELNHNLLAITRPNETALEPDGPRAVQNTFDASDRVTTQIWGDPPNAGGTLTITYTSLPGDPGNPNSAVSRTTVIDRAGNVSEYLHNSLGGTLEVKEFTNRNVRPGEGDYTTVYQLNADGMVTKATLPEGNSIEYTYDSASTSRFSQRNLLQEKRLPGPRGGDQTSIITTYAYEPVYNQARIVTDPRGNDSGYVPPLGSQSAARYTTIYTYDYQEGNNLVAIANETGITTAQASSLLTASGVSLNLGDVNGDGQTGQRGGNTIRVQEPTVLLPAGSSLIAVEGDNTQEIVTDYHYNLFGQQTAGIDPEGNITDYSYLGATDPDGDGTRVTGRPLSPWFRFTGKGGYLKETVEDSRTHPRRRTHPPVGVSNRFTYDAVGNRISVTDGNGNTTAYAYNQINQVVRAIAPAPFFYRTDFFYDANDNQTRVDIQNVTTNVLGANEVVSANSSLTTLYTYDILDNRLSETREVSAGEVGPAEIVTTNYRYDANENQIRVTQPEGNETVYVYDERDLLYSTTGGTCASGCTSLPLVDRPTTTVNYDGNENRTSATDAQDNNGDGLGETTIYTYDGYDRLRGTRDPAGGVRDVLYDPVGNAARERSYGQPSGPTPTNNSGAGNVLLGQGEYRYDELNRRYEGHDILFDTPGGPLSPDSPLVTKYEYDRSDRQVRVIDPKGHATSNIYDGMDRSVTTTDALGNTTTYTYDKNSNRIRVVETDKAPGLPDERFTTGFQYDSLDRLTRTTDNLGNIRRFFYDSRGNTVWTSDGNGPAIVDPSGEFPYSTTPPGYTTINGHGNTTRNTYDGLSRPVTLEQHLRVGGDGNGGINPAGDLDTSNPENTDGIITTTRDYDKNSRVVSEADDEGKATTYSYDALDRLVTKTNPDSTSESYQYDKDSHLTVRTDENGTTVNDTYDALDRRTGEAATLAGLPSVGGTTAQSFQYDGLGRMSRGTDNNDTGAGDDSTVTFGYDSVSRLLSENQTIGALPARTIGSTYDKDGNRASLTYPNGRVTSSEYDNLDRLDIINNGSNSSDPDIANYDYLGPARVAKRTYLNGTKLTMLNDAGTADIGYDGLRRTVKQRNLTSTNALIAGHDYAYDREDNKRYEKRLQGDARADVFGYDSLYRVRSNARNATDPNNAGTAAFTDNYLYDGVGNRITSTEDSSSKSYTHDAKNQYTFVTPSGYILDAKGNIADDGTNTYKYDYKDRLIQVNRKSDGSLIARYKYDAQNRRIRKEAASTVNFYWDGWQILEERNVPTDAIVAQYVYGNGLDEPLTMERGGSTYYYHQNQLGNVVAVTNSSGAIVEGYRYPAYGKPTVLTGPGPDSTWFTADDPTSAASPIGNRYMFTGREYDSETGFMYYRNRYYSPTLGRFLTRDPLGFVDGMNLYEYVGSSPSNRLDPYGEGYVFNWQRYWECVRKCLESMGYKPISYVIQTAVDESIQRAAEAGLKDAERVAEATGSRGGAQRGYEIARAAKRGLSTLSTGLLVSDLILIGLCYAWCVDVAYEWEPPPWPPPNDPDQPCENDKYPENRCEGTCPPGQDCINYGSSCSCAKIVITGEPGQPKPPEGPGQPVPPDIPMEHPPIGRTGYAPLGPAPAPCGTAQDWLRKHK